jgi:hypothetical protein
MNKFQDGGMIESTHGGSAEQPVARATTRVSNAISDLDVALDQLIQRINPALGPHMPQPSDPSGDKRDTMETSELAQYLDNQADRVLSLLNVVRLTTERVEL